MFSVIAGFQIQMVPSRWYIDNQKDKDIVAGTCFVNQEAERNFSDVTLVPDPSTVPMTVTTVLRCAAKKRPSMEKCENLHDKLLNSLLNMIVTVR